MPTPNLLDALPLRGRAITVAGVFRTRCGLQRGAQLMLMDLRRRGYAVNAVDLSAALHLPLDESQAGLLLPQDLEHLATEEIIIHVGPPRFLEALEAIPATVLRRARVIGYWVWELTVLLDEWRAGAQHCAALWAPSPFVAETLASQLPHFRGEIAVVPHQVDLDPMPRLDRPARLALRARHGLSTADFVCGVNFSFLSGFARKNPAGALEAFLRAFPPEDGGARLLIRTHDGKKYPALYQMLLDRAAGDPRVTIFDAEAMSWPMVDFLNILDVFISLHRSEGYGLPLAEAAQAGAATLATGWGLAPDIAARQEVHKIDYTLVTPDDPQGIYTQFTGARWAEPDLDQAVTLLQALRRAA